MTTDELIAQVLQHDAEATLGPWRVALPRRTESGIVWRESRSEIWAESDGHGDLGSPVVDMDGFVSEADVMLTAHYRTAAPLLARKLQRALELLVSHRDDTFGGYETGFQAEVEDALADIEEMQ